MNRAKAPLPVEICGEVARLPLGNGGVALIDARDAEFVGRWRWVWKKSKGGQPYVVRHRLKADGPGPAFVVLHRELMGLAGKKIGDHRNGDGLDCRRDNLRPCTHPQNLKNKRRLKPNAAGLKGISVTRHGRFRASIMADGVVHPLGTFTTAPEAHAAYVAAAHRLHGEFACAG